MEGDASLPTNQKNLVLSDKVKVCVNKKRLVNGLSWEGGGGGGDEQTRNGR